VNGLLDSVRHKGVIKVETSDPSNVVRVVVAYTEGQGEWLSSDLDYEEATLKWKGEITATAQTRFIVQAVDGAGNVQVAQNKGAYYHLLPPAPLVSDGSSRLALPLLVRNHAP
jgi:major membrane immunogen (membrane-anchored lipoprotein)